MQTVENESGFALPLTILVITVMTMMIATAHLRVRADRVIAESSGATVTAFAVAQSRLQSYFAYYDSVNVRPADGDSLRINVPNGYANVRAYKVKSPPDSMEPELYIVRSTGFPIEPSRWSDPQAQRTVAQFAQWQSSGMTIAGAFTAANGLLVKTPGTQKVKGVDQSVPPMPSVAGVRSASGGGLVAADFDSLWGSPILDTTGTGPEVANATLIDWPSIVGGFFDASWTAPTSCSSGGLW